jgi:hypothetical protein
VRPASLAAVVVPHAASSTLSTKGASARPGKVSIRTTFGCALGDEERRASVAQVVETELLAVGLRLLGIPA